ncbi:unnamed protein product, partial [Musa textilis]
MKMYLDGGDVASARQVFDQMPEHDVVSCDIMLSGLGRQGCSTGALRLFGNMQASGIKPDAYTIVGRLTCCGRLKDALVGKLPDNVIAISLVSAAAEIGELNQGRCIPGWVLKAFGNLDAFLGSASIDMYSRCGNIWRSFMVFENVSEKDVTLWTAMITGLAFHGFGAEALELFHEMQEEGLMPNSVTLVAVLPTCSHANLVDKGLKIFESMKQRCNIKPGVGHYGCVDDLLAPSGWLSEALNVIARMPMKPRRSIWGAILSSSKAYGDLELTDSALTEHLRLEPDEEGGYVLLSNAYAACGKWSYSNKMRQIMGRQGVKKTWGHSNLVVDGVVHEYMSLDKRNDRWAETFDS